MPVEFLEEEAIADIAFKVRADSLESIFTEACETVFKLQTDTSKLDGELSVPVDLDGASYERLLYNILAEILYYRDAEMFFGKTINISFKEEEGRVLAIGSFIGSEFDESKHVRGNDVKAITMHDFYLKEVTDGWEAYILVDI
ncbi:MAG: archease [Candidatus Heimdallarchaeota archaeon]|nr:archease [Candidatus Heimdallarchaeota archaeon]